MTRILLLAGTGHARRLASDLVSAGHEVLASLAGVTASPAAYPCTTRIGGFGGAAGLASALRNDEFDALVDATHPFAAQISANAQRAAAATDTPLFCLDRPEWSRMPDEQWIDVADLASAVAALPAGARAFLATGRKSLQAFQHRTDIWIALRQVDPPSGPFVGNGMYVIARPPFDVEAERALFASLNITHLVVKNAGGTAARTKLTAAASLGLPIIMIRRPAPPAHGFAPEKKMTAAEILRALGGL